MDFGKNVALATVVVIIIVIAVVLVRHRERSTLIDLISPCPPAKVCPASKPCPADKLCPPPATCPSGGLCPACPECPTNGVCPSGGLCPPPATCPSGGLCPPCPECPDGKVCPVSGLCPSAPEVFVVDTGRYGYTAAQADEVAAKFGATVATVDQVYSAYYAEADWCHFAWAVETESPRKMGGYLVVHKYSRECRGPGVVHDAALTKAGVTLYGRRPGPNEVPGFTVFPWNGQKWSRWD